MNALEVTGLTKAYRGGDGGRIDVLTGVDLTVRRGEIVAIVGASGAGKSTLLHCAGALERPTAGRVLIDGQDIAWMSDDAVTALRNRALGFVFQFHHLLRDFTALENVMMPQRIGGTGHQARAWARRGAARARRAAPGACTTVPANCRAASSSAAPVARALATDPAAGAGRRAVGEPRSPERGTAARPVCRVGARPSSWRS